MHFYTSVLFIKFNISAQLCVAVCGNSNLHKFQISVSELKKHTNQPLSFIFSYFIRAQNYTDIDNKKNIWYNMYINPWILLNLERFYVFFWPNFIHFVLFYVP